MSRLLNAVNCLYFPSCEDIPLDQLIDGDYEDLESYMDDYINSIQLSDQQIKLCKLMSKMGNDRNVYIASCDSTFIDELIVGLDYWSRIEGNRSISIILNLAYLARINRLLVDDDLLVRPLMRIIRWMYNRGIEVDIGLPLSYSFYPHTYDIHIINGCYPKYAEIVNMVVVMMSRMTNDRIAVIDRGVLTTKRRFNSDEADRLSELIRDYYNDRKVKVAKATRIIRAYNRSMS